MCDEGKWFCLDPGVEGRSVAVISCSKEHSRQFMQLVGIYLQDRKSHDGQYRLPWCEYAGNYHSAPDIVVRLFHTGIRLMLERAGFVEIDREPNEVLD